MLKRKLMLTLIFILSLNLLMCNSILATTKNDANNFKLVQHQLAQAKIINGKFTQERIIKVLSNPLLSSGHFSLSQNKGLKWFQEKPFLSTLQLSSSKLTQTIANNPPMVLTKAKQPLVFSFSKIFLSAFRGDQKTLNKSFKISFQGKPQKWIMLLTPKSSPLNKAVKSILLVGGNIIHQVIVKSAQGDKLIIKFYDVKVKT